jgi:general stress protein 26
MMRDAEKTIGNLIDKQSTAYVSFITDNDYPSTRAMLAPRKREGIRVFYLTTNTSSRHAQVYKVRSKACLYVCDRRFFRGVVLEGEMEVLEDSDAKRMIWQDGDTIYYPLGVDDPDYCVLRFTAHKGRYYSQFKSEDFLIEEH